MTSALEIVENLPKYFTRADLKAKQQLIGSVCPEKLIFENKAYRTNRINEVLALICSTDKDSSGSKKRLAPVFGSQSNQVPGTGIEPALPCGNQILSLTRLPVPPSGLNGVAILAKAPRLTKWISPAVPGSFPQYDRGISSGSNTLLLAAILFRK